MGEGKIMESKNKGSELLDAARDIVFAALIKDRDGELQRAVERISQAISDGGYMVDSPEPEKENSMSDLPRGNLSNDDPHEFGAGIEITQQAKYWRDRSQVWMRRAIELGWDAEKQAKCDTCNGTMIVGGFVHGVAPGYEDHPCPDCNPRAML